MLNCGANSDLKRLLEPFPRDMKFYILDRHRPVHHSNVRDRDRVRRSTIPLSNSTIFPLPHIYLVSHIINLTLAPLLPLNPKVLMF